MALSLCLTSRHHLLIYGQWTKKWKCIFKRDVNGIKAAKAKSQMHTWIFYENSCFQTDWNCVLNHVMTQRSTGVSNFTANFIFKLSSTASSKIQSGSSAVDRFILHGLNPFSKYVNVNSHKTYLRLSRTTDLLGQKYRNTDKVITCSVLLLINILIKIDR